MVHPTKYAQFDIQLDWLLSTYQEALDATALDMRTGVWRRFFCSDLVNQAAELRAQPLACPHSNDDPCAISWVGQPPTHPAKVALWAYHVFDPANCLDKRQVDSSVVFHRGALTHHWTTGLACPGNTDGYGQTREIFKKYEDFLHARCMTLADHVIRTWLFVRDVDENYSGLVSARQELFADRGLTPATHYIASTGIAGTSAEVTAKLTMDAYAISGLRPEQVQYLTAPDHLSPTHVYGVTFERGVSIIYRDRAHVVLSGTASIDHQGRIVHPGDVTRQLGRTLENIEALLEEAGACSKDLGMLLGYVRDPADQMAVEQQMRRYYHQTPVLVVVAPVCRPGWLVEVEGQAIIPATKPHLPPF